MKRTIISALAVSLILNICGCNTNGESNGDEPSSDISVYSTGSESESTAPSESSASENKEEYKNIHPDTKIKVIGNIDYNFSALSEKFKELYGVPEKLPEGCSEKYKDDVIVPIIYKDHTSPLFDLCTLILSDDSPDAAVLNSQNWSVSSIILYSGAIYDAPSYNFKCDSIPFNTVDDMFDFSAAEWDKVRPLIDEAQLNGKTYAAVTDYDLDGILFYKSSTVKSLGFEDPYELYKKGEWTWSKMLEMCLSFDDPKNERWGISGPNIGRLLASTTGTPEICYVDGKLTSMVQTVDFKKCIDYIKKLREEALNCHIWGDDKGIYGGCIKDKTLFTNHNGYKVKWEELEKKYASELGGKENIRFVPFPKPDDSSYYYQSVTPQAWLSCVGSKNTEGYRALTYASLMLMLEERNTFNLYLPEYLTDSYLDVKWSDSTVPVFDHSQEALNQYDFTLLTEYAYLEIADDQKEQQLIQNENGAVELTNRYLTEFCENNL